jgi:hypothetical protein
MEKLKNNNFDSNSQQLQLKDLLTDIRNELAELPKLPPVNSVLFHNSNANGGSFRT